MNDCNKTNLISCCEPTFVWADASDYYTKSETDQRIEDAIDKSGASSATVLNLISSYTYSMQEIDEKDAQKLSLSAFNEYSGTVASELSEKASESDLEAFSGNVPMMIADAISGKQDTLSAGHAISIIDNTVDFTLPIWSGSGLNSLIFNFSGNTANQNYCWAEGFSNRASNTAAHAEGMGNVASGGFSHAEGRNTTASQIAAHSEGTNTQAAQTDTHAEGTYTQALNPSEHAGGAYNISHTGSTDSDKTLFSVGNGTSTTNRHNAFEIMRNGDIYIQSGNTDILLQDYLGGGSSSGISSGEVQTMINQAVSGKAENSDLEALESTFSAFSATITNEISELEVSGVTSGTVQNMLTAYTYSKQEIDDKDAQKLDITAFSAYSGEVSSQLSGKASVSDYETLSGIVSAMSIEIQEIESSGVTSGTVQSMIDSSISGKMDTADFNIYSAATETKIDAKPNVWIGDEASWSAISGSTENGVIYLVY